MTDIIVNNYKSSCSAVPTTNHWLLQQKREHLMQTTITKSSEKRPTNMYKSTKTSIFSIKMAHTWIITLSAIFCLFTVVSARSTYFRSDAGFSEELPRGCSWQSSFDASADGEVESASASANSNSDRDVLLCKFSHVDSLNSVFGNLSVRQIEKLSAARIQCSEETLYESAMSQPQVQNEEYLPPIRGLEELQLIACKIRYVPSVVLSNFVNMKRFTLRTHNVEWTSVNLEFHRDSFDRLSQLTTLDLSTNNIWTLPKDIFCPLVTLRELNLSANSLTDVSQLGFNDWGKGPAAPGRSCNSGLEILDLSANSIAVLHDNGFSSLRMLQTLMLQDNHLSSLADRAFVGLQSLRFVNMSNNKLTAIPPELFKSPRKLQHLFLQNNSLKVLAPGLLEGLDKLEMLDLSTNELTSEWVNRNTFAGLIRLVVLNLNHNRLTKVDQNVFRGLYSLQILSLEHNNIDSMAGYAFSDLKNLHALKLSHNQLKQLDAYHFSDLYVLNQLQLDSNLIEEIHERAFENITHLQDLYLNDNYMDEIPNLSRLKFLKTLDMGKNRINSVRNESFEGLEQLVGLRLTDNLITNISRDAFSTLSSLHVLNLASNQINHIDQSAFISNPTLRAIRLDDNQLEDISSVFTSLPSLVWLNVSDNKLRLFDYSHFPQSLEWLDMHRNNIIELGNYYDVGNNLQIKMLDISFNNLTFILDSSIPNSIETLFLNDNAVQHVGPGTFASKYYLQKVVLTNNKIKTMEIAALALPPIPESREIPQFYLANNPMHCDCNMEWLQRINDLSYLRQHPHVTDLDQIQCTMEHKRGPAVRPLMDIHASEFLCKYESHCFALCHCCDFDACDCKMTCPDGCSCFHDHSWNSNIVDCGNAEFTQVPEKMPMDATTIYLDGNNFGNLDSHQFIGKKKLEALYLNSSNINSLHNGTFNGLAGLRVLHLESNNLRELRGTEISRLIKLRELNLENNQLTSIAPRTFTKMKSLQVLSMAGNAVTGFDLWQQLGGSFATGSLNQLSFDGVRLRCDCESLLKLKDMQKFLTSSEMVSINNLLCDDDGTLDDATKRCLEMSGIMADSVAARREILSSTVQNTLIYDGPVEPDQARTTSGLVGEGYMSLLSVIVAVCIGTTLIMSLVFVFRQNMRIWAHAKYGVRLFRDPQKLAAAADQCHKDKLYDAYVMYNARDSDFTNQILAGELQSNGYSMCLHHRDVQIAPFSDSMESIADISRKVIIVVSLNFVHNEWQQPQFRAALHSLIERVPADQRRHKFLIVLTAPAPLLVVDHLMQTLVQTGTVLCWGEKRFWEKMRYMLPDVVNGQSTSVAVKAINPQQPLQMMTSHHRNLHNQTPTLHHGSHMLPTMNCMNCCTLKSNYGMTQDHSAHSPNMRYTPAPTQTTTLDRQHWQHWGTMEGRAQMMAKDAAMMTMMPPQNNVEQVANAFNNFNGGEQQQQQQANLDHQQNRIELQNINYNNQANLMDMSSSTNASDDDHSTQQLYAASPLGHVYSTIPETPLSIQGLRGQ